MNSTLSFGKTSFQPLNYAADQLIESKGVVIQHVPWVYYELLLLLYK